MTLPDLSWMEQAACKGGTELMFRVDNQGRAPGLAVCARCPSWHRAVPLGSQRNTECGVGSFGSELET